METRDALVLSTSSSSAQLKERLRLYWRVSIEDSTMASPAEPILEEDLGKWLDLDGLCQDSLVDSEIGYPTPLDDYHGSTSMAAEEPQSDASRRPNQPQDKERGLVLKSKRKPPSTTRNPAEFSVICFPSNPTKPDGIKKKRRDFTEKRRLEVAQVRKTGACFRCKMRRISVRVTWGRPDGGPRADDLDDE